MKIPHSKPTIDAKDIAVVAKVLKSGNLAQGAKVQEFEEAIGRYLSVGHVAAVNSGTSALHMALLALKVGPGDEVMVPSYVCTAVLNAVFYVGAKPRVVDVSPDDFNISADDLKKKLSRKTKAIIVAHMFGYPADMKRLLGFGVPVIEDCAQSFGASYHGKKVGSWGKIAITSFYATKLMTTAEGGAVFSDDRRLIDRIRELREYDNQPTYEVRYNYKLNELQAALGLSQLSKLPKYIARRKAIATVYSRAWRGLNLELPIVSKGLEHIYYRYVITISKNQSSFIDQLRKRGIQAARPVFQPLHRYLKQNTCPVTDELMKKCVSLPVYPQLTETQIETITKSVRECF